MSFWCHHLDQINNENIVKIAALNFFIAFWKFLGLSEGSFINAMVLLTKSPGSPRKPKKASRKPLGSYKKYQGRNPEIISLLFLEKLNLHKDIIKSTLRIKKSTKYCKHIPILYFSVKLLGKQCFKSNTNNCESYLIS